jgi:hypothetical protein
MTRLTRGCIVVTTVAGTLILSAAASAANPAPGARFTMHHHETRGAGWHVQIDISRRHAGVVRSVELYDERCEETIAADRIRLAPDGSLQASADFTATDRHGREQPGHWELRAQFPARDRVEGSFTLTEPNCAADHPFAGARHVPGGGHHHHGRSDPFDYPDIAGASSAARAKARRMLRRVRAVAARRFPTIERARAQRYNRYMVREKIPEPGVFHLWSRAYNGDSAVLDPERPESLVYWKPTRPGARRVLLGFMFRLGPGPHPTFAGTIPSWHTHKKGGDQMTHVWLARSLRGAYANCLAVPELERSLHAFTFEDIRYDGHESQPCAQGSG